MQVVRDATAFPQVINDWTGAVMRDVVIPLQQALEASGNAAGNAKHRGKALQQMVGTALAEEVGVSSICGWGVR